MTSPWTSTLSMMIILVLKSSLTTAGCPWEEEGLNSWSDANTWGAKGIPAENQQVGYPGSRHERCTRRISSVSRLHKNQERSSVSVGNVDGLELRVNHIQVDGEFHLGKDTRRCRFKKKARIILQGRSDSDIKVEVTMPDTGQVLETQKAIVVSPGGVLEMHGADQKSWTKLIQTIHSAGNLCTTVFDIENSVYRGKETSGLHVMSWNPNGSPFDFSVFNSITMFTDLVPYLSAIPDGKIVAVAVRESIGNPSSSRSYWENIYIAMEELGSNLIRTVKSSNSYAFVVVKGQPSTAHESVATTLSDDGTTIEGPYVAYTDWTRRLEFSVRSVVNTETSRKNIADFKIFNTDVTYPILKLRDDVSSWNVGDQIVVASTDFDWRQAEVRTIIDCDQCQPNEVHVKGAFEYMHYGEISYNVDERAEVMLMSRSVVVQGQMEDQCYRNTEQEAEVCSKFGRDTFGGNIVALRGHSKFHVQHVELFNMGQQAHLGRYPLHFHMCDDASGSWVKNNSIHHTFSRCVTVHGTDNVEVSDNACYDHLGHGYFLEDSAEQNNVFRGNLGLGTQHGTLLLSDRDRDWCKDVDESFSNLFCDGLATFWITHPNNVFEDNVAAGSDNTGFMFVYANEPLGPSKDVQAAKPDGVKYKSTRFTPVKRFYNNVAHSNRQFGVMAEGRISNGEESQGVWAPPNAFLLEADNYYNPRIPNNKEGELTYSDIERLTVYKNKDTNMWLRGGNFRLLQSTSADAPVGLYPAHSVENTSVAVYDSIFVGETDNLGEPFFYRNKSDVYGEDGPFPEHQFNRSFGQDPGYSLTAISFANGPVFMKNCYFDRFSNWNWNDTFQQTWGYRPFRPAGALSFRRRNRYRSMPFNGVWDMKFGFCDNENGGNWVLNRDEIAEWHMMDGSLQNQFRDYDGSVTGQAGTQIVRNYPVFTGPQCAWHSNWNMAACPYTYAKVLIKGTDGVLTNKGDLIWPVILRRDDVHQHPFALQGHKNIEFLMVKNRSYTVTFNGTIPTDFFVKGFNMERGDVIRIGICLPEDTTEVKIRNSYVSLNADSDIINVNSIAELDQDATGRAIYWDQPSNMLFFKLMSREVRESGDWSECPNKKCPLFRFDIVSQNVAKRDCSSFTWPAYDDGLPAPSVPKQPPCTGPDSPEGLGALSFDDATPPDVYWPSCDQLSSAEPEESAVGVYQGCYKDRGVDRDVDQLELSLSSMTVQLCLDRCRNYGYTVAALQKGEQCRCGKSYGKHGEKSEDE